MRHRIGNIPPAANGWRLSWAEGPWNLYSRTGDDDWVQWKLVATERVPGKANYWLAYNSELKRFVQGIGAQGQLDLAANHPDLYPKVVEVIKADHNLGYDLL